MVGLRTFVGMMREDLGTATLETPLASNRLFKFGRTHVLSKAKNAVVEVPGAKSGSWGSASIGYSVGSVSGLFFYKLSSLRSRRI